MGLLDSIKADAKKTGGNKGKFIYFREGQKQRIRFLNDMEDGLQVTFHDSYERGINVPCQELFGRTCPYCEDEGIRTRTQYIWSVWNYESKEVQLFMFPVNNCSPIPAIVAMYESYGTLMDRDYVISVTGKQQNKSFSVVPQDKVKFRNVKAKPYSKSAILKMLDKAFPCDAVDDEDDSDDEEEAPRKKKKSSGEDVDYSEMTAKELYKLCKERDIEAEPRKPSKYYTRLLEEYDKAQDDWGDEEEEEDDGDDWEEEDDE